MSRTLTGLSRRSFLLSSAGFPALLSRRPGPAALKGPSFIDVHTHPGAIWTDQGLKQLQLEEFVRWMDAHGVERACLLAHVSPEARVVPISPDQVLQAARRYPERLIPFTNVDPRSDFGRLDQLVSMLNWYKDRGVKGFGEHKVGLPIDDPLSLTIYEACELVRLPLLLHMDSRCNTDDHRLSGLKRVLERFPELALIAHGPAWWSAISGGPVSGGYPKGSVRPGGAVDSLMDSFPNLYADLSAGSGANAISRDREFGREFLIRRADRLLFGTDYLRPDQHLPQFELLSSLDLPYPVRRRIYRENAIQLLRL